MVRRFAHWTFIGLCALVVILALASAAIYLWLRTSLPQTTGTLQVPGLQASVTVGRDLYGVPTIRAANQHDAIFALGFVEAQDRMFEMDLIRRYGEGRLAEIAGKSQLGRDRLMRTLGIGHAAELQWQILPQPVRATLSAYADGVNAYIAHNGGSGSPYYHVMPGPERWRPQDSLVIELVMSLYLAQNFHREILHARLAAILTPEQMQDLYPSYPKDGLVTLASLAPVFRELPLRGLADLLPPLIGYRNASNNWVLDGRHSVSGKPILENDPHLLYTAPPIWYLARVEMPGLALTGGFIPGEPFLVVGHNGHVGWGFTETGGDVEDLFIEKTDPAHPGEYLTPQGWTQFDVRQEVIHVKGGADETLTIRSTRHGPIISDVMASAKAATPKGDYVLALQATFLQANDRTPQALWEMGQSKDWKEFYSALRNFAAPQMNIVFADTGGTIGFAAPARIPIRRNGDGWFPVPGWTDAYDWTGFIPFDQLPQAVNPPSGRFISANNKIVPDSYGYFITHDWAAPYRADRIAALLDSKPVQSLDSTAAIQADVVSLAARQLLPLLLRTHAADSRSEEALALLRDWDGRMGRDQPAPLIYTAWMRALDRALFAAKLGDLFPAYWKLHPVVVQDLLTRKNAWCDVGDSTTPRGCGTLLSDSLRDALAGLETRFGGDPRSWRWAGPHRAEFHDPALSQVPLIGGLLALSIPAGGGMFTINAGDMNIPDDQHPFADQIGPSLRMILDFSDLSASRFLIAPGMSGNPVSSRYGDLMQRWRDFEWLLPGQEKAVETLTLLPQ